MPSGSTVNLGGHLLAQGEKTVGSGTVQLTTTIKQCSRIWFGAPTANHTKGAANTGRILIGITAAGNASGGVPLETNNLTGFYLHINDASKVYLTGFNAGDVVEYQIWS